MRKLTFIALTTMVLLFTAAAAAEDGSGGTISPFSMGAGSRSIGMGSTSAAVWGGSYSLIWNPAGLESIERAELSLFHTPLFDEDASYSSALASYPFLEAGTISIGLLQLGIGGIETRDEYNMITGSDISSRQSRYMAGYSRRIYDRITGGMTLKLDRFVEGAYSASGFGVDVGFGYQMNFEEKALDGLALGMTIINIVEPNMKLAEEESGDPRGLRAGIAVWGGFPGNLDDRLLLAFDISDTRLSETGIHAGLEYSLEPYAALRVGIDDGSPTFGLGFGFSTVSLDYAFKTSDLESYHLFSLTVGFGATRSRKLEERQAARELEIREQIDTEIADYEGRFIYDSLREAEKSMAEGSFEEAAGLFEKVLLMDPENEEAKNSRHEAEFRGRVVRADSLFEEGDYAGALLLYRSISEMNNSEDLSARISSCEQLISRADDRRMMVESIFERGLELYSNRKWLDAAGAFKQVLGLSADHELASSYLEKSERKFEEERNRTMLRIDESIAAGRYANAAEMIRAGVEQYGNDPGFESRLARIRQLQSDAEQRKSSVRTGSSPDRRVPSEEELKRIRPIYESGAESFREGRFDNAANAWEQVWAEFPDYENLSDYLVKAYQYWGMELYTKHMYEEALEVWERILKVDSENEKALRYISRTKEELEQLENLTG